MSGRVVVITGGNSGIGLGFARGIVKAGGAVVIWGRRADKNEQAASELRNLGGKVLAQTVDVSNEAAVVTAMSEAVSKMGRVDGVIANAGIMTAAKSFTEMSGEFYQQLIAI